MTQEENREHKKYIDIRKERIAGDIMRQVREQMIVWLPFLNRAILRMPYSPRRESTVAEQNEENAVREYEKRFFRPRTERQSMRIRTRSSGFTGVTGPGSTVCTFT